MEKVGYVKLARKITQSEIWKKPPEWFKIWTYILLAVSHSDGLFPRGTNFFNWSDDKRDLPNITTHQWNKCVAWLKQSKQIATRKTTRGNIITVINYSKYQDAENYKAKQKATQEAEQKQNRSDTIRKELKNERIYTETKVSPEVNSLMGVFKKLVNPNLNFANKTERKACENLLKDYSLKDITENLELIAEHQKKGTPYMPIVTTPYEMYTKWAKLEIFFNKHQ